MNISEKGKALIKSYEGCRLTAYLCPAGVWTIGYGRTSGVTAGQRITQAQADAYFNEDIKRYEAPVQKYTWLNQNQFDALTSFCYNCGQGSLASVMSFPRDQITSQMSQYIRGGGKVLEGLVRRREEEVKLYNTPVATPTPPQTPAPSTSWTELTESGTFYPNTTINFRNKPIVNATQAPIQGQYHKNEFVKYDRIVKGNGYVWVSWISTNKVRRYMPVRTYVKNATTGKETYGALWGLIK